MYMCPSVLVTDIGQSEMLRILRYISTKVICLQELRMLIFGAANQTFSDEWRYQALSFCDLQNLKYGIHQKKVILYQRDCVRSLEILVNQLSLHFYCPLPVPPRRGQGDIELGVMSVHPLVCWSVRPSVHLKLQPKTQNLPITWPQPTAGEMWPGPMWSIFNLKLHTLLKYQDVHYWPCLLQKS